MPAGAECEPHRRTDRARPRRVAPARARRAPMKTVRRATRDGRAAARKLPRAEVRRRTSSEPAARAASPPHGPQRAHVAARSRATQRPAESRRLTEPSPPRASPPAKSEPATTSASSSARARPLLELASRPVRTTCAQSVSVLIGNRSRARSVLRRTPARPRARDPAPAFAAVGARRAGRRLQPAALPPGGRLQGLRHRQRVADPRPPRLLDRPRRHAGRTTSLNLQGRQRQRASRVSDV